MELSWINFDKCFPFKTEKKSIIKRPFTPQLPFGTVYYLRCNSSFPDGFNLEQFSMCGATPIFGWLQFGTVYYVW